jgi:hypothetical protein
MTNTGLVWRLFRVRHFRVAFNPSMFDVFEDYWLISFVFYVLKTSDVDALRLLSLQ